MPRVIGPHVPPKATLTIRPIQSYGKDTYAQEYCMRHPGATPEQVIRHMMGRRSAELHTVTKSKHTLTGSPFGDFEAWMESDHSLPLVIRGEHGQFINGVWRPTQAVRRVA
jgi:hypothetical protein